MIELGGFFRNGLVTAVVMIAAAALPAWELPTASPAEVGMSSERLAEIGVAMRRHIDSGAIQGAVTAVARRGKVVHFEAHGVMDVASGRAMRNDAIFRMASSSKPVLAAAAMILIEEGVLHPADPAAAWLPQFAHAQVAVPGGDAGAAKTKDRAGAAKEITKDTASAHRLVPAERPVTIHHLLTHTSGLDAGGLGSAVSALPAAGPQDTLASRAPLYAGMTLDFQPGAWWGYSPRIGYDVVARIIEIVSGMPYDRFVRARIFEPLGMTDTHFHLPPEKESRRVVIHGIDAKAKRWDRESRYVSASGGLSSTAADYLRFEQMLANGGILFGNRILGPRSVAVMSGNQVGDLFQRDGKQPGVGFGYGVAVVIDPASAKSARGRGAFGWAGAFGTTTWTDPAHEISAVLMVQQADERVVRDFENAILAAIVD